jgi:hypothetical protein
MTQHAEICRFSSNGKTFFFNKAKAKNGSPYLTINALYGQGNRERVILFEGHFMQFYRCMKEAIGATFGVAVNGDGRLKGCDCGAPREDSVAYMSDNREYWVLGCNACNSVFDQNKEGAAEYIAEERGWNGSD